MKNMMDLTFVEIRDKFLNGKFDSDDSDDEAVEACDALHSKLSDIKDLLPLLESGNRASTFTGVYIAALEGNRTCAIFSYILDLMKSDWVEVRDESCDCFTSCVSKPEQFSYLFRLLDDPEESIRLKVIMVMACLTKDHVDLAHRYVSENTCSDDIKNGVLLMYRQLQEGISPEFIKDEIQKGTNVEKCFVYAVAVKEKAFVDLRSLSQLSGVPDLIKHHEIYYDN